MAYCGVLHKNGWYDDDDDDDVDDDDDDDDDDTHFLKWKTCDIFCGEVMSITTIPLDVLHKHFGKETYPSTYIKDDVLFIKTYQCVHFPFCLPVFCTSKSKKRQKNPFRKKKVFKHLGNFDSVFPSPPSSKGELGTHPPHRAISSAHSKAQVRNRCQTFKVSLRASDRNHGNPNYPHLTYTFPPRNSRPYDQGLLTIGFNHWFPLRRPSIYPLPSCKLT